MALRLITKPVGDVLTLDEAKAQLRVIGDHEDELIQRLLDTEIERMDGPYGVIERALLTQVWELIENAFPAEREIELPLPPLQSVDEISYVDVHGNTQILPADQYEVDIYGLVGRIALKPSASWPATEKGLNKVVIRFTCGYGEADVVPLSLKHAMLLRMSHHYEYRENTSMLDLKPNPDGYMALVAPYRMVRV